jgi:hypothetical protein
LRPFHPPSQQQAAWPIRQWFDDLFQKTRKKPWLKPCLNDLASRHKALTVAGQWRNFTAFPSILAIVVLERAAHDPSAPKSPETVFSDINIYSP